MLKSIAMTKPDLRGHGEAQNFFLDKTGAKSQKPWLRKQKQKAWLAKVAKTMKPISSISV